MSVTIHSFKMSDDKRTVVMELLRDAVSLAVNLNGLDLDLFIDALIEFRDQIRPE